MEQTEPGTQSPKIKNTPLTLKQKIEAMKENGWASTDEDARAQLEDMGENHDDPGSIEDE